jgi:predicted transcriptional regulator
MNEPKRYIPWQTPEDNDARVQEWCERLEDRGVKPTITMKNGKVRAVKITKSGVALKYILDLAEIAESMGIKPEQAQA